MAPRNVVQRASFAQRLPTHSARRQRSSWRAGACLDSGALRRHAEGWKGGAGIPVFDSADNRGTLLRVSLACLILLITLSLVPLHLCRLRTYEPRRETALQLPVLTPISSR